MQWNTILVPYDFSTGADHALSIAIDEARLHGAQIALLHVVELTPHYGPETTLILPEGEQTPIGIHRYARSRAEAGLRELVARVGGDVAISSFVREGAPTDEIVTFIREHAVDVVVMGTHGRTGFRHLVAGSVAERVVRTSEVPVLTTRHPA
jgi:nucleotide-binding universal stress UspA family protein